MRILGVLSVNEFGSLRKRNSVCNEFIDLNNKPKWYTDLVPSTLVPAAKIEGELVYESTFCFGLEARFSDSPLLPADPRKRDQDSLKIRTNLIQVTNS